MLRIIYISTLMFLSACAVGPNYKTPEVELPVEFDQNSSEQIQALDLELAWWKSFNDSQLDELIQKAIHLNKEIEQALSRIRQARELRRGAVSELLPGAQLTADYEKGKSSGARFPQSDGSTTSGFEFEAYSAGIDALWEIDLFGRLRRDVEAKQAELDGRVAGMHDALRMVVAEVATTYFDLRAAQKQLEIAEQNLFIQQDSLDVAKAKFEFGVAGELDVFRSQALLNATKASVPLLNANVNVNIHRLSVLLGKLPKELDNQLSVIKPIPTYGGPINIGTPEDLLRRRPDIRVAERSLAAQTALVGVRFGELFPKVELFGSIGVEASDFADLTDGVGIYRWGPSITWSPFDTGRLRSQVRAQDARAEEALSAYQQTVLEALEDVENSLARFSAERERRIYLQAALAASRSAYSIAESQYKEGILDFLSLLDAQKTVLQNESDFVESDKSLATYVVGIYKALGGGWQGFVAADKPAEILKASTTSPETQPLLQP